MTAYEDFASVPPFSLLAPAEQRVPFVFNSPHSGRHYPDRFWRCRGSMRRPFDGLRIATSMNCSALPSRSARRFCAPISPAPIST